MKTVVIICLVVVVIERLYKTILTKGERFCKWTDEFDVLMKKIKEIRENEEICNVDQAVYTDSFMFVYTPYDLKNFFDQFEELILEIQDCYKWVENWEDVFQPEKWDDIQRHKPKFADLVNKVRREEWLSGYKRPF